MFLYSYEGKKVQLGIKLLDKETLETVIQAFIMDEVFIRRPNQSGDWYDYMMQDNANEVEGFVVCSEYGFYNVEGIQSLLSKKMEHYKAFTGKIGEAYLNDGKGELIDKGTFVLKDELSGFPLKIEVESVGDTLLIRPEGYMSNDGGAPIRLNHYVAHELAWHETGLNLEAFSNLLESERTDCISMRSANINFLKQSIEALGFTFGENLDNLNETLLEYFKNLEKTDVDNSKEAFAEYIAEEDIWSICDCCGKIDIHDNYVWFGEMAPVEGTIEEMNTFHLLAKKSPMELMCHTCFEKAQKFKVPTLKTIAENMAKNNLPYKSGDIVLLGETIAPHLAGTPVELLAFHGHNTVEVIDPNDRRFIVPFKSLFDVTELALVEAYCNFVAGYDNSLTEELDDFSLITFEGLPEIETAFERFGYKQDFIEFVKYASELELFVDENEELVTSLISPQDESKKRFLFFVSYAHGDHYNTICESIEEVEGQVETLYEDNDDLTEGESYDMNEVSTLEVGSDTHHEMSDSTWFTITRIEDKE